MHLKSHFPLATRQWAFEVILFPWKGSYTRYPRYFSLVSLSHETRVARKSRPMEDLSHPMRLSFRHSVKSNVHLSSLLIRWTREKEARISETPCNGDRCRLPYRIGIVLFFFSFSWYRIGWRSGAICYEVAQKQATANWSGNRGEGIGE